MIYTDRFSTAATRRIFSDETLVRLAAKVEAAIAVSQADLGMIPADAARAIEAMAERPQAIDLEWIVAETERTTHTFIGILRGLQRACAGDAGQYLHIGVTTQDVQDTVLVLQLHEVLGVVQTQLGALIAALAARVDECAALPVLGRTQGQPALPMTFGLRIAGWLDELLRQAERLRQLEPRLMVIELFGAVGSLAGFGENALKLVEAVAVKLGLAVPRTAWHTARDRVSEYITVMSWLAATCARIANELRFLASLPKPEIAFSWHAGVVGSSTMPQKRNPEDANQIVVLARLAAANLGLSISAMGGEGERDTRAHRLEWVAVPEVSHHVVTALALTLDLVAGIEVNEANMRANLAAVPDVSSERLMLALTPRLGRQAAHEHVYGIAQRAKEEGLAFSDEAAADPVVRATLGADQLSLIFDNTTYLGQSVWLARAVAKAARQAVDNGTIPTNGPMGKEARDHDAHSDIRHRLAGGDLRA